MDYRIGCFYSCGEDGDRFAACIERASVCGFIDADGAPADNCDSSASERFCKFGGNSSSVGTRTARSNDGGSWGVSDGEITPREDSRWWKIDLLEKRRKLAAGDEANTFRKAGNRLATSGALSLSGGERTVRKKPFPIEQACLNVAAELHRF